MFRYAETFQPSKFEPLAKVALKFPFHLRRLVAKKWLKKVVKNIFFYGAHPRPKNIYGILSSAATSSTRRNSPDTKRKTNENLKPFSVMIL